MTDAKLSEAAKKVIEYVRTYHNSRSDELMRLIEEYDRAKPQRCTNMPSPREGMPNLREQLIAIWRLSQWAGPDAAPNRMHEVWQKLGKLIEDYNWIGNLESSASSLPQSAREKEISACLERERTAVADGVKAIKDALDSRHWLTEGRGPYEWDDDRWHGEFAAAAQEIFEALKPLEKIAADFKLCPMTHEEVQAARGASSLPAQGDDIEFLRECNQSMGELCRRVGRH